MGYCDRFKTLGSITLNNNTATCSKFPNYLFYNDGSIFNIRRQKFLKKSLTQNKYEFVFLCNEGEQYHFYVHRLIYLLFVDDIPGGYEIEHLDHKRNNNKIDNLTCITIAENRKTRRKNNNEYKEFDKKHNDKYKKYYHDYHINKKIGA